MTVMVSPTPMAKTVREEERACDVQWRIQQQMPQRRQVIVGRQVEGGQKVPMLGRRRSGAPPRFIHFPETPVPGSLNKKSE